MRNIDNKMCYYHGTSLEDAKAIVDQGFKTVIRFDSTDPDDLYWRISGESGHWGRGLYLTKHIDIATFYGNVILRVEIDPSVRIADISEPADPRVIKSLVREFGRKIVDHDPRHVLPKNKRLTKLQLVELLKLNKQTCEKEMSKEWTIKNRKRWYKLGSQESGLVRLLKQYGFGGYGHVSGYRGMGFVIFDATKVTLREVVASYSPYSLWDEWNRLETEEELRAFSAKHGCQEAKDLADKVATRNR